MFKVSRIENAQFYVDKAMKAMQDYATKERENISERYRKSPGTKKKDPLEVKLNKRKDLELQKIRFLNERINQSLSRAIGKYPKFKKVEDIYLKLIDTSDTPVKVIEDALKRVNWIGHSVDEFTKKTEFKLKKAKSHETVGFLMKKHLGKVNSLFKKNKDYFQTLQQAARFMNKLPEFEDLYTVAIGGFPNVGKSTLMNKISGSDVEIQNYPFTTKGLMFGYLYYNNRKCIQMIDTPGLLNRGSKDNAIEERAKIVLTKYCDSIVFVLDITESCGYTIEEQIKLLKTTSNFGKPLTIYLSKTDIYDEEDEERLKEFNNKLKKFKVIRDSEELKREIIETYLGKMKKFDPKKIKLIK